MGSRILYQKCDDVITWSLGHLMKFERTKNATRNILFGVILHIYQIVVPFIMRTAMIYYLGVQYLGLNSLFVSVLSVLRLAELGVGAAMVFSMYKPIAEDDTKTICALMQLYKIYYRIIGLVIAIIGLALTPFIPRLIHGDLPAGLNIYILYLLHLASTVLSYWLFAYKNCLLTAHQRNDVTNKVAMAVSSLLYAVHLFILLVLKNYYCYIVAALISQAATNIMTAVVVDKMYPQYQAGGTLPTQEVMKINKRVADLFTSKVGSVVVNSADTIVISAFLGLTALAIYQNYFYIMNSVIGFIGIIMSSCTAGIGNSLVTEGKEKNLNDLNKLTFMISWISGFCAACFLTLYQPFMITWVGKDLLMPFNAVICFCVYFYVFEINRILNTFKDAGGIWHKDRFRPLITALGNLGMNLLMVRHWGLFGIILSTVISMLIIGMPWLLYNLFTELFDFDQLRDYLFKLFIYAALALVSCLITGSICGFVRGSGWAIVIIRGLICCIVPNMIFLLVYRNTLVFKQCVQLVDRITKNKLHLERRLIRK